MIKLYSLLSITLIALFVVTSCSEKDDQIIVKGKLTSASYSPSSNKFTLEYSNGSTKTVNAIIDNSTVPPSASATLENGAFISVSDASIEGKATIGNVSDFKYVNDWIFEEMNVYYFWNDLIPKKPDFGVKPEKFFDSLLNKYNKTSNPQGDRFSWIQEDYADLLGSLSGVSSDEIGFDYAFAWANQAQTKLYAIITYPKLVSDAYKKGIERGRVITAVDGKDITNSNYRNIFSGTGSKTLSMADFIYNNQTDRYALTSSGDVKIQMERNYAENPVYLDSVYSINGKEIGYLVYNFFATGKGKTTHEYDQLLMNTLAKFKAKGATEMVLDLRYNGGGAVSSAIALSSALVKNRSTDNILVTAEYNDIVDNALKQEQGANYNKDFFIDKIAGTNIQVPTLDLLRLYVLVTGGSASASEFVINGLKPYMEVILVGETTYGKNVGSISIYEENDPKNKWGMQPIIVKYYNSKGESDFTAGFKPNFEVDEFDYLPLVKFGNLEDPLLNVAINHITGNNIRSRSLDTPRTATTPNMIEVKGSNSIFKDKTRFEMLDDVRGDEIKKLMKK